MMIMQLIHVKNICKNVKNLHMFKIEQTDLLVRIIELLRFLHST